MTPHPNSSRPVLGCNDANLCNHRLIGKLTSRSINYTLLVFQIFHILCFVSPKHFAMLHSSMNKNSTQLFEWNMQFRCRKCMFSTRTKTCSCDRWAMFFMGGVPSVYSPSKEWLTGLHSGNGEVDQNVFASSFGLAVYSSYCAALSTSLFKEPLWHIF